MKIIERYPAPFKMLAGRGAWALLYPAKVLLAGVNRIRLAAGGHRPRGGSALPSNRSVRPLVIGIGNLEAGGAGKTPCSLRIARGIAERGGTPVVISRGYGSIAERRAPCVVPSGRELSVGRSAEVLTDEALLASLPGGPDGDASAADALGDEILLYRSRGISVVIDQNRGRGAELARRMFSPTHVILDDAFQNASIGKDVEILLLDAEHPFGNGHLLPLGTLRETPSAVRRADIVVFTRAESECIPWEARPYVADKHVFFARHEASDLMDRSRHSLPLSLIDGRECVLFSAIARPESFERMVISLGARPRAAFRFVDHHRYTREDVQSMLREAAGDVPFVTTEKDWAKAHELFPPSAEVLVLRIEMRIGDIEGLLGLFANSSS
ncbi:MAG: tetraacyldisaccharide 4'-kinase [Candidatus Krumholzibacteria bacterium]|nr:tetraacyldisaccharide 4'-kinase [Candidatus Krumholzibacteria bacterium]